MKKFFFAIVIFLGAAVFFEAKAEVREISGFVISEAGSYFFVPVNDTVKLPLRAMTQQASTSLRKLKARDYIFGSGEISFQNEVLVYNIEFVGLRALLGNWKAQQGSIFSFVDFKHAQVSSAGGDQVLLMNYAISPSGSNAGEAGWKVFFSNDSEVSLGNLSLSGRNAVIEFFDEETGQPTRKVLMNKID